MLLIAPGCVWSTKSLLQLSRRVLPSAGRDLFCTNYLLSTDHLEIPEKNIYTAMELATAIPLYGPEACMALLQANTWAIHYLTGYLWNLERARHALPVQPFLPMERLTAPYQAQMEQSLLKLWNSYWNRKYHWLDPATRTQRFKDAQKFPPTIFMIFKNMFFGNFHFVANVQGLHFHEGGHGGIACSLGGRRGG